MREVDRQAIVERVAPGEHDLRLREDAFDQTDMEGIVGSLVGEASGGQIHLAQPLQIALPQVGVEIGVAANQRFGIGL